MIKRAGELMSALRGKVANTVDAGDVVGLIGLLLAFDGARSVFGAGWARLGLGLALVAVYVARELRLVLRKERS